MASAAEAAILAECGTGLTAIRWVEERLPRDRCRPPGAAGLSGSSAFLTGVSEADGEARLVRRLESGDGLCEEAPLLGLIPPP